MDYALLWDLDGTLVDSEPVHDASFKSGLAELGLTPPDDIHDRMLGLSGTETFAVMQEEMGLTLERDAWVAIKERHYRIAAEELGVPPRAASLSAMNALDLPGALVSNSSRFEVDFNLEKSGLASRFEVTIARDDVENGKPDPEGYLMGASRLGIDPKNCIVIEDSHTGARAGLAAGTQVVFFPETPGTGPDGVHNLAPDGDLTALLRKLSEGDQT